MTTNISGTTSKVTESAFGRTRTDGFRKFALSKQAFSDLLGYRLPTEECGGVPLRFAKVVPCPLYLLHLGNGLERISDAKNFGLTFVAASTVSATLIDGTGAIVATILGDTPEAGQIFRSISVDRAITKGIWTVRFQSKDHTDREIILSTWSTAN